MWKPSKEKGSHKLFKTLSPAKVNWTKSVAFAIIKDSLGGLVFTGELQWMTGGLKYLGVFLGNYLSLYKKLGRGPRVH